MKITNEFSYRSGKELLQSLEPKLVREITKILNSSDNRLNLSKIGNEKQERQLSKQIQTWFVNDGWKNEKPSFSIPKMRYDLLKKNIPIEIELGHERLVYADFFEFMADYSKQFIPLGVMIVAGDAKKFGHKWHNSLDSTKRKIEAIEETFLVPLWIIGVEP